MGIAARADRQDVIRTRSECGPKMECRRQGAAAATGGTACQLPSGASCSLPPAR